MADGINSDRDLVALHEGCTLVAKPDAKGRWAIGYGHDIPAPTDPTNPATCTQAEADAQFVIDLCLARSRAAADVGTTWAFLDPVRRAALTDMAYELGGAGLRGFNDMLVAIQARDWLEARHQALNSEWARQVPARAQMDAEMLFSGEWPA